MLLAKAVERSGPETASVAKFFSGLKGYEGGSGLIEFNSDGDRTSGIYKVMDAFENKSRS